MPLVDLKTDLKSLKFGGDRQGGGWSGQPFINSPIQDSTTSIEQRKRYDLIRNSTDFPIRGGAVDFNLATATFTVFSTIDKERIKKFMNSKPRGSAFLKKQIGLQLSNPNTQTGDAFFNFAELNLPIPAVLQNTKIYNNGINTLTQVGLSGTGLHATRQGTVPINPNAKYYSDVVGAESLKTGNELYAINRLLLMSSLKLSKGDAFSTVNISNINQINKLGISRNKNVLFDYLTGPGSVYGVGKTTIRRYSDTRNAAEKTQEYYDQIKQIGQTKMLLGSAMTYDIIAAQNINSTINGVRTKNIQDFTSINDNGNSLARAIKSLTRENIYSYDVSGKDLINELAPKLIRDNPWANSGQSEKVSLNDIIKFGFECISNDDPTQSTFLQFRAYLTSGISDSNQASWANIKYIGRGEDFFTYQGFTRSISFSFRVAAQSEAELKPIYNKLNFLVSQVYPDYSLTKGIMRGSVVKLTIGDYFYRMPGILESVNLSMGQETSWDITDGQQLPHFVDVNISFKPILNELPRRATLAMEYDVYKDGSKTPTSRVKTADRIPTIIANREGIVNRNPNPTPIDALAENNRTLAQVDITSQIKPLDIPMTIPSKLQTNLIANNKTQPEKNYKKTIANNYKTNPLAAGQAQSTDPLKDGLRSIKRV
jgi:hypothetical protein